MVMLINPGSGGVPLAGDGWTNTVETARAEAQNWLAQMHDDGMTDVELLPGERENNGRWIFTFRHKVTGVEVELETHGINFMPAYEKQCVFAPKVYWKGSSVSNPELENFAAPGFRMLKAYVRDE